MAAAERLAAVADGEEEVAGVGPREQAAVSRGRRDLEAAGGATAEQGVQWDRVPRLLAPPSTGAVELGHDRRGEGGEPRDGERLAEEVERPCRRVGRSRRL